MYACYANLNRSISTSKEPDLQQLKDLQAHTL